MNSINTLRRRIDKALSAVEDQLERQRAAEHEQGRVTVRLPVKDNEPAIPYQRGLIHFFVPEHRLHEAA